MKPGIIRSLHGLYEARRTTLPAMGERTVATKILVGILATALASILISLTWVQKSDIDYLRGSSGVQTLDELPWSLHFPGEQARAVTLHDLGETSVERLAGQEFRLEAEIDSMMLKRFVASAGKENIILSLPDFQFETLRASSSWAPSRDFVRGEPLAISFSKATVERTDTFKLTLTVVPRDTQLRVLRSTVNQAPAFLAVQSRYQKFQDFLAAKRIGSGKQLADIGRIVLALFAVLLFIFIDSSPECLGLGIFMALKAMGVVVSQAWIPDGVFAPTTMEYARHFLFSSGDFMQLYFFTQLARLWRPRPMLWLGAAVIFGTVYTMLVMIPSHPGGVDWSFEVWKYRSLLIGMACMACALPIAVVCFKAKLYHRSTALLVAASGVVVQIVTPLIVGVPGVTESYWYQTWYNLFEAHTPYMFALSTFINVSTLEQRVQTLSRLAISKDAIERDLKLGKAVQDAFFRIPELPKTIELTYSHSAAAFVSGDILYSNWDRERQVVTVILCDIVGHGVQAALKASICSAMAASIWEDNKFRPGDDLANRLIIFHDRVTSFLSRTSGKDEMLAMSACEVDLITGESRMYRANGLYPIILSQNDNAWVARTHAHISNHFDVVHPENASFIILCSDGLVSGSRVMKNLLEFLVSELAQAKQVDASSLKNMILEFDKSFSQDDDKTLAIIDVREVSKMALQKKQLTAA